MPLGSCWLKCAYLAKRRSLADLRLNFIPLTYSPHELIPVFITSLIFNGDDWCCMSLPGFWLGEFSRVSVFGNSILLVPSSPRCRLWEYRHTAGNPSEPTIIDPLLKNSFPYSPNTFSHKDTLIIFYFSLPLNKHQALHTPCSCSGRKNSISRSLHKAEFFL